MKFKTSEDVIEAFNQVSNLYGADPKYQRLKTTLEALGAHKNHFSEGDEEIFDATVNKMELFLAQKEFVTKMITGSSPIRKDIYIKDLAKEMKKLGKKP